MNIESANNNVEILLSDTSDPSAINSTEVINSLPASIRNQIDTCASIEFAKTEGGCITDYNQKTVTQLPTKTSIIFHF